jgi:hypothetical protein
MNEQIRAEFEEWWKSQGYNPDLLQREAEGYSDGTAQVAYFAMQSAHARYAGIREADKSTLGFFAKYDFDKIAKVDDGRALVHLTESQFNEIKRLVCASPASAVNQQLLEVLVKVRRVIASTDYDPDLSEYFDVDAIDAAMLAAQEPKP